MENPGLIYCALYNYDQFGAKASCGKADVDVINQCYSGVTAVSGEPENGGDKVMPSEFPTKAGNWMGWYAGGAWAALAILAASHYRHHSGKGQFFDISPSEAFGRNINYAITYWQGFQQVIPRVGNLDVGIFPFTLFQGKVGYAFFASFAKVGASVPRDRSRGFLFTPAALFGAAALTSLPATKAVFPRSDLKHRFIPFHAQKLQSALAGGRLSTFFYGGP